MVLNAVRTESSFKQIDDTAMFELAGLNFEQIVRESEEPKACIAQLAERRWNLRVGWHRGKLFRELFLVPVVNLDATCIRQHFHHGRTDIGKRYVAAGDGQGGGIHDQVGEP